MAGTIPTIQALRAQLAALEAMYARSSVGQQARTLLDLIHETRDALAMMVRA